MNLEFIMAPVLIEKMSFSKNNLLGFCMAYSVNKSCSSIGLIKYIDNGHEKKMSL